MNVKRFKKIMYIMYKNRDESGVQFFFVQFFKPINYE